MVIDANSGRVLHQQAADEARYPASLTKMMTLYIVFELMQQGKLSPATRIRISDEAASTPPSKLGLKPGSDIALMDALKIMSVKSANDVSVAVAEHIAGREDKFAALMTRKARQLGMANTTFRNAHGLPAPGQVTTARDMLTLALRLQDDFPQHYGIFGLRSFTYAGVTYRNHNTMLATYPGMDGLKTGYTTQSGFNLVASVRRGGRHLVAAVFGGSTAAARNAHMRTLLDRALPRASTERTRLAVPVARVRRPEPSTERSADVAPRLIEPPRRLAATRIPDPAPVPPPGAHKSTPSAPPEAAPGGPRASPSQPGAGPVLVRKVRPVAITPTPAHTRPDGGRSAPGVDADVIAAVPAPGRPSEPRAPTKAGLAHGEPADVAGSQSGETRIARFSAPQARLTSQHGAASEPMLLAPPAPASRPASALGMAPSTLEAQARRLARGELPVEPVSATGHSGPQTDGRTRLASGSAGSAPHDPASPLLRLNGPPAGERPQGAPTGAGVAIQVGAYASEAEARRRLTVARDRAGPTLARAQPAVQPVEVNGRTLYRARFTGLEPDAAARLCTDLRRAEIDCLVARAH